MFDLNALRGKFLSVKNFDVLLEANGLSIESLAAGAAQTSEELQEKIVVLAHEKAELQTRLSEVSSDIDGKAEKVRLIGSVLRSLGLSK